MRLFGTGRVSQKEAVLAQKVVCEIGGGVAVPGWGPRQARTNADAMDDPLGRILKVIHAHGMPNKIGDAMDDPLGRILKGFRRNNNRACH